MKELLKYLAAGVLIAALWAAFGGIEWKAPADKAAAETEIVERFDATIDRVSAKAQIKRIEERIPQLRENLRLARTPGEAALAQTDLETEMRQLEEAEVKLQAAKRE